MQKLEDAKFAKEEVERLSEHEARGKNPYHLATILAKKLEPSGTPTSGFKFDLICSYNYDLNGQLYYPGMSQHQINIFFTF